MLTKYTNRIDSAYDYYDHTIYNDKVRATTLGWKCGIQLSR